MDGMLKEKQKSMEEEASQAPRTRQQGNRTSPQIATGIKPTKQIYAYEWNYTLKTSYSQGEMDMIYHLRNEGTDYGTTMNLGKELGGMEGMVTIMDIANEQTISLMAMGGYKSGQVMSMPFSDIMEPTEEEKAEQDNSNFEIKEIGKKQILGYECQGFEFEMNDATIVMYIAFDTPVSFTQIYQGQNNNYLPSGLHEKWLDKMGDKSILMEMESISKTNPEQNIKMVCTNLSQEKVSFDLSEYQLR